MSILKVMVTVVLFAVLIVGIIKKMTPTFLLLCLGMVGLLVGFAINGSLSLAEVSGSRFLDVFEYFQEASIYNFTNSGLLIMMVMGYATYMEHIHASESLARLLVKPLSKIKNKYILAGVCVIVAYLFLLIMPSGIISLALLLGTLFPVLSAVGLSTPAIVTSFILGCCIFAGPANVAVVLGLQFMHVDMTSTEYFVAKQLPVLAAFLVIYMITNSITQKYWDKKEQTEINPVNAEEIVVEAPKWFAILPCLPLILMIVLSTYVVKTVVISVVAAVFVSFLVAIVSFLLTQKDKLGAFNSCVVFFNGLGVGFAGAIMVAIGGYVFSAGISEIGGIEIMLDFVINRANMGIIGFSILMAIMYFLVTMATGTGVMGLFTVLPILYSAVAEAGVTNMLPALLNVMIVAGGLGMTISPVSAMNLFASAGYDLPISTIIKRNIIPAIVGFIVVTICSFVMIH